MCVYVKKQWLWDGQWDVKFPIFYSGLMFVLDQLQKGIWHIIKLILVFFSLWEMSNLTPIRFDNIWTQWERWTHSRDVSKHKFEAEIYIELKEFQTKMEKINNSV